MNDVGEARGGGAAGFTLIEALVALTILVLVGSIAAPMLAGSARNAAKVEARFRAVIAAESIIQRAGLDLPYQSEPIHGRELDGTRWTLESEQYSEPVGDQVYAPIGLLRIRATAWPAVGSGPPIKLETLRIRDELTR